MFCCLSQVGMLAADQMRADSIGFLSTWTLVGMEASLNRDPPCSQTADEQASALRAHARTAKSLRGTNCEHIGSRAFSACPVAFDPARPSLTSVRYQVTDPCPPEVPVNA